MRGYRIPETKQCCALVIVEPMEKFRGKFVRGIRCGVDASVRDVEGKNDSATGVTLVGASYCAKASRATHRSGADAVPKMSPGSRSLYPMREIVCLPEPTKCSKGVLVVVGGNHIHHIMAGECGGSVKANQVHRNQLWCNVEKHTPFYVVIVVSDKAPDGDLV